MMDNVPEFCKSCFIRKWPLLMPFSTNRALDRHAKLEYPPVQPFLMSRYLSGDMPIDFLNIREK